VRKQLVVFVLVVAAVLTGTDIAVAEARVIEQPATYKGRIIDFARDWEGARACVVLRTDDIRCFASEAEQWRELAKVRRPAPPTATLEFDPVYCLDRTDLYVIFYENTGFGGNSVSVNEASVWKDLSVIGLDNAMSSWKNNTYCDATAATGSGGGGSTLTLAARSQNTDVGSTWNDLISSVKINL
jgi:hypothetical protein